MSVLAVCTGSVDLHFEENNRIAISNAMAGRPLDEGWLPPTHRPDPNGLPDTIYLTMPDDAAR